MTGKLQWIQQKTYKLVSSGGFKLKFIKIKRSLIVLLLAFSTLLFGANASANQVEEMFQIESCASLKDGFRAVTIKANDPNANTDDLKFNYLDALECNTSILDKNIFTKVNYIMFGDVAIYANEITTTLVKTAFGFKDPSAADFSDKFRKAMKAQEVKPIVATVATASAISEIMMVFSLLALILFIVYYIYNSASDGEAFGKGTSFAWIAARIGVTIVLIVPLEYFGGFAAIQVIVLAIASFANLLANVVAFMLPLFEFLDKTDFEKIEFDNSSQAYGIISELVDRSVESHICDTHARSKTLFESKFVTDMNRETVENDDFYNCVKNWDRDSEDHLFVQLKSNKKTVTGFYKSKHQHITERCAIESPSKEVHIECSNNTYELPIGENGEPLKFIYKTILDKDDEFRSIAIKSIKSKCSKRIENLENADFAINIICSTYDGYNIEYTDGEDTEKVKINEYGVLTGDLTDEAIEESILKVKKDIYKSIVLNIKEELKRDIVEDKSKILDEKLGFSLMKGWMSSASFMLEAGQNIKDTNNRYISEFSRLKPTLGKGGHYINAKNWRDADSLTKYLPYGSGYGYLFLYSGYEKLSENTKDAMYFKLVDGGDREDFYLDGESTDQIMRIFFPGIIKLKKLSGGSILTNDGSNKCIKDFNQCRPVGVNPLKDVIEMGSDMMSTGFIFSTSSKAISAILKYAAVKTGSKTFAFGAEISSLLGTLFMLYMLLGAAILYMPSILIFGYFLGNAVGWLSNVLIFTSISILWVVMHFFPDSQKGFAGKASYGYKKLLDILLRPTFVVFGVFVTFIITSIMLAILNVLFAITINTFELFNAPNTFIEFIMNYIVYVIYLILVIVVLWRSIKSIYKVPNALMEWFDLENDENQNVWSEMSRYFTYNVTTVLLSK